jgi:hypothetical protein
MQIKPKHKHSTRTPSHDLQIRNLDLSLNKSLDYCAAVHYLCVWQITNMYAKLCSADIDEAFLLLYVQNIQVIFV